MNDTKLMFYLKFNACRELYCERTDVAACHPGAVIFVGILLLHQFGTSDATLCSRLVQEVDNGGSQ